MRRLITAALTMVAVALVGISPAPVAAGDMDDDLAKYILFSALLVAIANSSKGSVSKPEEKGPVAAPQGKRRQGTSPRRDRPRNRGPVQARCLEDFWDGNRWVTFVDYQCRRFNQGKHSLKKAEACRTNRYRSGRRGTFFDLECMRHHGFKLARHR